MCSRSPPIRSPYPVPRLSTRKRPSGPLIITTWRPRSIRNATGRHLLPEAQSQEDVLVNAYSILQSAAATAYENADNQTGANRKAAMGVVHLIELAELWVDSVLDKRMANVSG